MSIRIYGNRLIRTPNGQQTRPTLGRVRTAVFGRWQAMVEDAHWLDLCAGAGTMGAEALARGAQNALGIEISQNAAKIAAENWERIAPGKGTIWKLDIVTGLERLKGRKFDLIYFDPPYQSGLYLPVLEAIGGLELLAEEGELAAEHDRRMTNLPEQIGALIRVDYRVYSDTAISYYQIHLPEANEMLLDA
ncbi:MAG: 16S rRNA (guanine(966)-N(2))-methyltransferase RsmD [Anaerolineae bacterium]|nr:16S rRNA (guanine(966)-N(2))-methyltransferase RsmD [Gloeobacterales cyanobacterium ES-bin-313]